MDPFDDFGDIVKTDEPLAPLAWFRLGGPAAYFARPRQFDELVALLKRCRAEGITRQDPRRRVERPGAR